MALTAILSESAHGALEDDSLKNLYRKNNENNQYYLDIAPDEAGKLAFNLQTEKQKLTDNNGELLKQKNAALAKLKSYESLGKTADEIKESLEATRPEEVTKLVTDYEAKLKSVEDSYKEVLTKETEQRQKAQADLEKTLVDSKIATLRADFDLNDTSEFVLREFIKPVRNEETGEITTSVFENNSPALIAGQPKTPEQLLSGFKDEKKYLSIFNAPAGGGTGGTNRQNGFNNKVNLEGLSGAEMLKVGREQQRK